jgi:FG-GAP repeat
MTLANSYMFNFRYRPKSNLGFTFRCKLSIGLLLISASIFGTDTVFAISNKQLLSSNLSGQAKASISATVGHIEPVFHFHPVDGYVEANNAKHGIKARFSEKGLQIDSNKHHFTIEYEGIGRAETIVKGKSVKPYAKANRVEYQREGVTEWYINGPLGLEQGFTLEKKPKQTKDEVLSVSLKVTGDLHAYTDPSSEDISLRTSTGQTVLRYRGLVAWDSTGQQLPAWWQVNNGLVELNVDDRGTHYPITIDPFIEQAKLVASDGAANDTFGRSIAISGNTVVVGAEGNDPDVTGDAFGSAYVFDLPIGGWTGELIESAKLNSPTGTLEGHLLGHTVAIDGDTVVVGGFGSTSSAYVYVKPTIGWLGVLNPTAKLRVSDGAANDSFGASVSISGDTIVAGAFSDDIGANLDQGAAYIFEKPTAGWASIVNEQAKLLASNGVGNAQFGYAVSIHGNTVVVGAKNAPVSSQFGNGIAYVFEKPVTGWAGSLTENAQLRRGALNISIDTSSLFASSVDVHTDTIVVGSERIVNATLDEGRGYVYVKPESGWSGVLTQSAILDATDGLGVGHSVAISQDYIVLGASESSVNSQNSQGAAYIFKKPVSGWSGLLTQTEKLTASDGAAFDDFGRAVAIDGNNIAIGAEGDDIGTIVSSGSAYVFAIPDTTAPITSINLTPSANANGWYNAPVHFTLFAEDEEGGSGLAEIRCALDPAITPTEFDNLPGVCNYTGGGDNVSTDGLHTLYAASMDNAGNKEIPLVSRSARIDTVKPTISADRNPSANSNGWVDTNVTVSFQCADNTRGSGLESCSPVQTLANEGANQGASGTAQDLAGNTETASINNINIDKTLPGIIGSLDPQANINGWHNTDVTILFSCTDNVGGSGVGSCSPTQILAIEGTNQSAVGSVTDLAGNANNSTVNGINIDKTLPSVNAFQNPLPNANGWNNTDVAVSFTCLDNTGGSGISSCSSTQALSDEGVDFTATGTANDLAGNSANALISGIQIDKTQPNVTVNGITQGATYTLGAVPTASCATADSLSGVQVEAALGITGGNPDGTGSFTANCTGALDRAGNSASAAVSYQVAGVTYTFSGFFQPVDNPPTFNQVKGGSGIAVKFSLGGDFGLNILAVGSPATQGISCDASMPTDEIEQTVNVGSSTLNYNPTSGQYSYNWKTQKTWSGTCRKFILTLSDGTQHVAYFKFK